MFILIYNGPNIEAGGTKNERDFPILLVFIYIFFNLYGLYYIDLTVCSNF